jgi:co-chaperonin GroES (HSP10)
MRGWKTSVLLAGMIAFSVSTRASAQQAPAAPRAAGTVKAVDANGFTLTSAAGQDVSVSVPAAVTILEVAPGSHDLKSATPGALADVAVGDKVLVNGSSGDTAITLTAQRVVLMKSAAIVQAHAADEAAWAKGGGGIVKSVDAAAGTIMISSGMKMMTVTTTPATIVRRYSGDSVRFEDATTSTVSAIQPGDQLRVRGTKSADGTSIQADEIVTGSFQNYSGLISAIDGNAETVTLKDLSTKKVVTVMVTPNSNVRRLPAQTATMLAMRMKGGAGASPAAGGPPTAGAAPSAGTGSDAEHQRAGRTGTDLSQMLSRLPTETLGGLKTGEAVMIVASTSAQTGKSTAITLLVGVDALLAAPAGQSMTLSPWSVGSASPDAAP